MKLKIFQAVTERIMVAGIPRLVAIIGGTISAAMVLGTENYLLIPVILIIYIALYVLYKKDPYLLEVILLHLKDDDTLEP